MPRIISFLGAFGSGKTTKVNNLRLKLGDKYDYVYEDDTLIEFLKQSKLYFKQASFLNIVWYKFVKAMDYVLYVIKKGIITDTHPLHGLVYAQTFFEMESGMGLNLRDLTLIQSMHFNLWKHFQHKLRLFDHTVYYINLPLQVNYDNIVNRNRPNMGELDIDYLKHVRRNMALQLRPLAEDVYNAEVIEINTLEELDKIKIEG